MAGKTYPSGIVSSPVAVSEARLIVFPGKLILWASTIARSHIHINMKQIDIRAARCAQIELLILNGLKATISECIWSVLHDCAINSLPCEIWDNERLAWKIL